MLIAADFIRRHAVSPVVLICGVLPLAIAVGQATGMAIALLVRRERASDALGGTA